MNRWGMNYDDSATRIKAERLDLLPKLPVTQLIDLVTNSATWPQDMRLEAVRILRNRTNNRGTSDLAFRIQWQVENRPEFAAMWRQAE